MIYEENVSNQASLKKSIVRGEPMTEKIDYINASIAILEKREELNYDELAVLCNLKKFVYQTQAIFKVGEYYQWKHEADFARSGIYKITRINKEIADCIFLNDPTKEFDDVSISVCDLTPATAEQIAMFKRAEQFAKHGRKLDEFHVGDITTLGVVSKVGGVWVTTQKANGSILDTHIANCAKGLITLIQTAEELQEEAE